MSHYLHLPPKKVSEQGFKQKMLPLCEWHDEHTGNFLLVTWVENVCSSYILPAVCSVQLWSNSPRTRLPRTLRVNASLFHHLFLWCSLLNKSRDRSLLVFFHETACKFFLIHVQCLPFCLISLRKRRSRIYCLVRSRYLFPTTKVTSSPFFCFFLLPFLYRCPM